MNWIAAVGSFAKVRGKSNPIARVARVGGCILPATACAAQPTRANMVSVAQDFSATDACAYGDGVDFDDSSAQNSIVRFL